MIRSEFIAALKTVRPALSNQDFIPMLSHFCFTKGLVYAFDDVLAIEADCPIDEDIEVAIPGDHLFRIVDSFTTKTVDIVREGDQVSIKAGRSWIKLPVLPKDSFVFRKPKKVKKIFESSPEFIDGLANVLLAVGDNPIFPYQMGVTMVEVNKGIILYATNNVSISECIVSIDILSSFEPVQLPSSFCKQVMAMDDFTFFVGSGCAEAISEGLYVYTKLPFDANVERLQDAVTYARRGSKKGKAAAKIPPKLLPACERASVIMEKSADVFVLLTSGEDKLTLEATVTHSRVKEEMKAIGLVQIAFLMQVNARSVAKGCESFGREGTFWFSDTAMVFELPNFSYFVGMKREE